MAAEDPTAPVAPDEIARMLADAPTAVAAPADVGGPTLAPGTELGGRYRIVRFLARGGMGEVYEAADAALRTRVALKTIRAHIADDPLALARFRREIGVARTVTHPNVCRVFDLDHHDVAGRPALAFYTMELIAGETLAARLRRAPPSRAAARRILDDLLAGIGAAHAAGVIHRDLKPANVMLLDRDGRAVITDFGLALPAGADRADAGGDARGDAGGDARGDGTSVAGTPAYMAPELLAGAPPSVATDVFALGVCMFELQHGRLPLAIATRPATTRGPATRAAPAIATGDGAAWRDRRWERATRACLAEDPASRPTSVEAVRALLRPPRAARGVAVAGALTALTAVAAGAIALVGRTHDRPRAAVSPPVATAPTIDARPPAFPPGPVTSAGGCAYAPAFLDDDTLIYDHSTTTAMDVYRLRAGGQPERLTADDTQEWRALPGLTADEIVYVVSDVTGHGTSRLAARNLATGVERTIATQVSPAVAAAGGAYYYVSNEGARLRRVTGDQDEIAITMPDDAIAQTIVASHDGRSLVAVGETASAPPTLCVIDLATGQGVCPDLPHLLNARAAFAPDDRSVIYATDDGLRRRWLGPGVTRDELLVAKVRASGIAVSPSGALVWTDCMPRGVLRDVTARPPVELGPDDRVATPAVGAGGELAYVRRRRELVVRGTDGVVRALGTPLPAGAQMAGPAWDAAGARVAVTVTSDEPGLYVYDARRFVPPTRVTIGRAHTGVAWLGDDLLFDQWDGEHPRVFRVGPGGGPPRLALRFDRLVVGVDHQRGEVLLASPDETLLYWWDPRTGRQRRGPPATAAGIREVYDQALAPGGRWLALQLGRQGHRLFRVRLDDHGDAIGAPEPVWDAPAGVSMSDVAIGDDGAVIVAPIEWRGELHAAEVGLAP